MSPEERMYELLEDCDGKLHHFNAPCGNCTVAAIRAAAEEWREACAKAVEYTAQYSDSRVTIRAAAATIRERGE